MMLKVTQTIREVDLPDVSHRLNAGPHLFGVLQLEFVVLLNNIGILSIP